MKTLLTLLVLVLISCSTDFKDKKIEDLFTMEKSEIQQQLKKELTKAELKKYRQNGLKLMSDFGKFKEMTIQEIIDYKPE